MPALQADGHAKASPMVDRLKKLVLCRRCVGAMPLAAPSRFRPFVRIRRVLRTGPEVVDCTEVHPLPPPRTTHKRRGHRPPIPCLRVRWPESTCLRGTSCTARVQAEWTHDDETGHAGQHRPAVLPGAGLATQDSMNPTSSGFGVCMGFGLVLRVLEPSFVLSGHRSHLLHGMQVAGETLECLDLLGHAHGQQQSSMRSRSTSSSALRSTLSLALLTRRTCCSTARLP